MSVRYVTSVAELHHPDMVILPGTKNTMSDLKWMRQNGLEAAVRKLSEQIPVFGICGGYQMLGEEISDPDAVEEGGVIRGMELLNTVTILKKEKKRCQTEGALSPVEGVFRLSGLGFQGYEIHMGSTSRRDTPDETIAENVISDGNLVYGSYIHGIFDRPEIAQEIITCLAQRKGIQIRRRRVRGLSELQGEAVR